MISEKKKINVRDPEKYEYAQILYIDKKLSQKDVCERIGINAKTLKSWIDQGGWAEKRVIKVMSPDAMINRLMQKADQLMNGEDFEENATEICNAISKLIRQIKTLKNSTTNNDRVQSFLEFSDWLIAEARHDRSINDNFMRQLNTLQDKYIMFISDVKD